MAAALAVYLLALGGTYQLDSRELVFGAAGESPALETMAVAKAKGYVCKRATGNRHPGGQEGDLTLREATLLQCGPECYGELFFVEAETFRQTAGFQCPDGQFKENESVRKYY
jgi:hypothetical protein